MNKLIFLRTLCGSSVLILPILASDRKTATPCLVGDEKIRHIEYFKTASDQQLREAANSIADLKIGAITEYTAEESFVTEFGKSLPIKFGKVGKTRKFMI